MTPYVTTGYYGVPGNTRGDFKVHVVSDHLPICGWKPSRQHEFQWCASGIQYSYIECERCRKKAAAILKILYVGK